MSRRSAKGRRHLVAVRAGASPDDALESMARSVAAEVLAELNEGRAERAVKRPVAHAAAAVAALVEELRRVTATMTAEQRRRVVNHVFDTTGGGDLLVAWEAIAAMARDGSGRGAPPPRPPLRLVRKASP